MQIVVNFIIRIRTRGLIYRKLTDPLFACIRACDEKVVAVSSVQNVRAKAAVQHVVAVTAHKNVIAIAAHKFIIAALAIDSVISAKACDDIACVCRGCIDGDIKAFFKEKRGMVFVDRNQEHIGRWVHEIVGALVKRTLIHRQTVDLERKSHTAATIEIQHVNLVQPTFKVCDACGSVGAASPGEF